MLAGGDDFADDDGTSADDDDGEEAVDVAADGLRRAATNENTSLRI